MSASNDGFDTTAQVHLEVPSKELRNVRHQIESAIGTTEVGVTDGGSMSAQAAGGGQGGRARRRARRSYRMEIERTDYMEEAVVYLESIEDKIGDDSGLMDLLGGGALGGLLGGAGGAAGGIASGAGSLLSTGIGSAVGTAVGDALSNTAVSVESDALTVEEPGWPPIEVEDPGDVSLEYPETIPLDAPDSIAVDDPGTVGVEDPSPLAVEDPSPLAIETIDPLAVEEVDPIDVNVNVDVGVSTQVGGMESGGARGKSWAERVADAADVTRGRDRSIGEWAADVANAADLTNPRGGGSPRAERRTRVGVSTSTTGGQDVTVHNESRNRVTVDPRGLDDLERSIISAVEDGQEQNRRELMQEVEDLRNEIERMKNSFRGGL